VGKNAGPRVTAHAQLLGILHLSTDIVDEILRGQRSFCDATRPMPERVTVESMAQARTDQRVALSIILQRAKRQGSTPRPICAYTSTQDSGRVCLFAEQPCENICARLDEL